MKHKTFRGGVHPKGYKELSLGSPIEDFLPSGDLVFPVNQHIGKPAKPIVKKGDRCTCRTVDRRSRRLCLCKYCQLLLRYGKGY